MPHPRFESMTRAHVIEAARTFTPKRIQRWSCVEPVDGTDREFPVKQLFMAAANQVSSQDPPVTPADFIPHFAVARLRKLGFVVRYVGDNGAQSETRSATQGGPMPVSPITVPERVLAFLRDHCPLAFCDDCIAKNVGINRYMAHQATLPFGLTSDFNRGFGACAGCGQLKLITAMVAGTPKVNSAT